MGSDTYTEVAINFLKKDTAHEILFNKYLNSNNAIIGVFKLIECYGHFGKVCNGL